MCLLGNKRIAMVLLENEGPPSDGLDLPDLANVQMAKERVLSRRDLHSVKRWSMLACPRRFGL